MKEILDFLRELSCNNNRDWFLEHKDEYKKAKRLRDIGIGLSCTGFFCWAGIPMAVVGANKMKKNQ